MGDRRGLGDGNCHPYARLHHAQAEAIGVVRRNGHGAQATAVEPRSAHQGGGLRWADPHDVVKLRDEDLPADADLELFFGSIISNKKVINYQLV